MLACYDDAPLGVKQIISTLILVGVLSAAGYGIYKSGAFSPEQAVVTPTPTAKAKIGDIEQQVLATGQVAPISETEIRSEVSGQVTALQVTPGERVKKDQPLLQLDRRELESEANEDNFQIIADQLRVKQAQSELDRDQQLISKGFIPQKEYDDAQIALSLAQNDLEVQKAKLETLHQQIIKTDIRAPHEGIVLKLDVREGEVIVGTNSTSSGTVLMRIADLSKLKVDTRLNEVDVVRVHVNDHVKLTFDAVPGLTMPGTVTYISPSADTGDESTSSGMMGKSSSTETGVRGFQTTVALDTNDARIRPGITAHVVIAMAHVSKVVTVPLTAVFNEDDGRTVAFLKHGDTFDKRDVDTGLSDDATVEIRKGIADKDEVALERPTPKVEKKN